MRRLLVAGLLAGCATQPAPDPAMTAEAVAPLTCSSRAQCDLYWQRAQVWVANNGAYRIRAATDTMIETFGPLGSRVDMAYRIVKVPTAGGASIEMTAGCANVIRCAPTLTEALASFKRYVRAAQ